MEDNERVAKTARKDELRPQISEAHNDMVEARESFRRLERRWRELRDEYEKLDYELALEDKRYTKVSHTTKTTTVISPEFTLERIQELARRLNVDLEVKK